MTDQEILFAFNNRWRVYGNGDEETMKLCLDFFRTGCLIQQSEVLVSGGCASTTDDAFDTWWNLYDKKRGKEKCLKKWKKLSAKDKKACIESTPAYVASTPDKQYRKDPLTFLNNKSFYDEIISRNPTPTAEQKQQHRLSEAARLVAEYASEGDGAKD